MILLRRIIARLRHKHHFKKRIGGIWADEPGGPRTYHEIWWQCDCGKYASWHDATVALRAIGDQ